VMEFSQPESDFQQTLVCEPISYMLARREISSRILWSTARSVFVGAIKTG